jgi:sulfate adenylyltransferase (ADP) / ATP adenylyltransferase
MGRKTGILFRKGTLRGSVTKASEHAVAVGALLPIPTGYEFIQDCGVGFFVRILANLARKDEEREKRAGQERGRPSNPFSPFEKELFVADVSETHVAVLNKFNVLENHLLIITREFEDQEILLTREDFEALLACLLEYDALGFYNGGEAAGASQSHKHLQLVPLPVAPEGPRVPMEPLLAAAEFRGGMGKIKEFPFLHAFVRLDAAPLESSGGGVEKIFGLYCDMLRYADLKAPSGKRREKQSGPYCLLLTREWMLLVPRSREFFHGVSVNSLGFAGALLVRNSEEMAILKRYGPMSALRGVGMPPRRPHSPGAR